LICFDLRCTQLLHTYHQLYYAQWDFNRWFAWTSPSKWYLKSWLMIWTAFSTIFLAGCDGEQETVYPQLVCHRLDMWILYLVDLRFRPIQIWVDSRFIPNNKLFTVWEYDYGYFLNNFSCRNACQWFFLFLKKYFW
jgi:hypothetical protein